MTRQSGFTLIEVIAVLVVLATLAVIAVPKFVDLQGAAREAALNGTLAAMNSADLLVYGKAIVEGVNINTANQTVDIDAGTLVEVTLGYPESVAEDPNQWDITGLVNITGSLQIQVSSQALLVGFDTNGDGTISASDNCHILRRDANSATRKPSYTLLASKC